MANEIKPDGWTEISEEQYLAARVRMARRAGYLALREAQFQADCARDLRAKAAR